MRFSGSWCGLFTGGIVGGGLSTWGAWAARNFCRERAENAFQKIISIPYMNMTASIGSGPLLPIHLVNFTLPIKNAFADDPSAMTDDVNMAGNICMVGTLIPAAIILALLLGLAGVHIHAKHQLEDALGRDVVDDDDAAYTRLDRTM